MTKPPACLLTITLFCYFRGEQAPRRIHSLLWKQVFLGRKHTHTKKKITSQTKVNSRACNQLLKIILHTNQHQSDKNCHWLTNSCFLYPFALLLPLPLPWFENPAEGVETALTVSRWCVGVQDARLGLAILASICPRHRRKRFLNWGQDGTATVLQNVLGPHPQQRSSVSSGPVLGTQDSYSHRI